MGTLQWCMLGAAATLLVAELVISQLCTSILTLLDAFHTLFILMHMFLHPPHYVDSQRPSSPSSSLSSSETPSPTSPGESSPDLSPVTEASPITEGSLGSAPPLRAPPTSVSFTDRRFQTVGDLLSNLTLASLCVSYTFKILGVTLEPQPVQRPLLVVMVAALSLLFKTAALCVNWAGLQEEWTVDTRPPGTDLQREVKHSVSAAKESDAPLASGRVPDQVSRNQAPADSDPLLNGALVLCNPGASSVPVAHSQTPEIQPGGSVHQADSSNGATVSPVCKPSHSPGAPSPSNQGPLFLLWLLLVAQALLSAILTLVHGLVMVRLQHRCLLLGSGACGLLPYLDQALSMLTVVVLIITTLPQLHRCGLVLLQASPPHLRVSDLERRIAGVHGVQGVHDLHVWQLTRSFLVASVHVRCHAWFPAHRCGDLMSTVTEMLQGAGVSCCTVQPEFAPYPAGGALCPACLLCCGKDCLSHMCCAYLEEEEKEEKGTDTLASPAGSPKDEPLMLVIENSFLQLTQKK